MKPPPVKSYLITPHARFEMQRRSIPERTVRGVLISPGQRHRVRPGRDVLQSKLTSGNPPKTYVVRVFVDVDRQPTGGSGNRLQEQQGRKVLEGGDMKVSYDPQTDTLRVIFKEKARIAESDEDKPGVILDYDKNGNLVSLEILDASKRVSETRRIEFQLAE